MGDTQASDTKHSLQDTVWCMLTHHISMGTMQIFILLQHHVFALTFQILWWSTKNLHSQEKEHITLMGQLLPSHVTMETHSLVQTQLHVDEDGIQYQPAKVVTNQLSFS